ncbi:MAG: hypothetical protein KDJ65_38470 [Anaerolineae bacterium]|jgi:hypothetical protein|nr:hypothetical protein [Anaerolineae bacterium]
MGFFNWLRRLFEWFLKIWNSLDDETKRKIIDAIIKAFEPYLGEYYQHEKQKTEGKK